MHNHRRDVAHNVFEGLRSSPWEWEDKIQTLFGVVFAVLPFASIYLFFTDRHAYAFAALIAWLVMQGWLVADGLKHKKREEDRILKRKRDGLDIRSSDYTPVNADEWNLVCNRRRGLDIDWLEDQAQSMGSHLALIHLLQCLNQAANRSIVQTHFLADLRQGVTVFQMRLCHRIISRGL